MRRTKLSRGDGPRERRLALQVMMGLALTAMGLLLASQRRARVSRRRPMRDYSGRTGLPRGVEASRGIARDAPIPPDMLTPESLRPFTSAAPR